MTPHDPGVIDFRDGEPWCRNHERPLRECLAPALKELHLARWRDRVRETALTLMCDRGDSAEDAVCEAVALERLVAALPGEEP